MSHPAMQKGKNAGAKPEKGPESRPKSRHAPSPAAPLPPGSVIGILGGGQLGRMLAMAAARLGFHVHVYCPDPAAPAFELAQSHVCAPFDDQQALDGFARQCNAVTFEFENIPLAAAALIAGQRPLNPSCRALEVSQDRAAEKSFLASLSIKTARWRQVSNIDDLQKAQEEIGGELILKSRRMGYDGKGQARLAPGQSLRRAFEAIGSVPAIAEQKLDFDHEISIILARGLNGESRAYDPALNQHEGGILRHSTIPAPLPPRLAEKAAATAQKIAAALDYAGVLAVEFFVAGDQLLVNEIAPRVHNSGHWTIDACLCSQFENHIRAVAGWPLGKTSRHSNAEMINLIGDETDRWPALAARPDCALHLYGKQQARPGRKMGHITCLSKKQPA